MFRRFIFVFLLLLSANIYAQSTNCADKITTVTSHSNGNVYFNTANVCSQHWCVLGTDLWNTPDKLKNALSVLLTANTTQKDVVIEWYSVDVPNCSTVLDAYATPRFIMLK